MLLSGYTKKIFRPECNPSFQSVHCIARLNEEVGKVLPYLNAVLGGTQYFNDPPEVMFHHHGKIIKVGAREIAVNALKDEQEADLILKWLKTEINQAWENRAAITPCNTGKTKLKLKDNTILITGGGSGIGLELTKAFLKMGNTVIICGRSEKRLQIAKKHLPQVHIIQCDISDQKQREELFFKVTSEHPGLNILINNAVS